MDSRKKQELIQGLEMARKPKEIGRAVEARKKCNNLADSFKRLGYDGKAARVRDCGTQLIMAYIFAEDRLKLHRANFCRERLCPMCAFKRTRQVFAQVSQVMDAVQHDRPELVPLFLTLTLRNCTGLELSTTLDTVFQGWNRMNARKRMRRIIKGWFRALEITYNEQTDTYHPHIHAILMVEPSYFSNPKDYMATEKWVSTWRKSLRVDYDPICDVRTISYETQDEKAGAVAEAAKYTVKDTDYIKADQAQTDKLVDIFNSAIRGRRLYAFGGILKEKAKELKLELDSMTPEEIQSEDGRPLRQDVDYVLLLYRWNIGLSRYDYEGRFE